MHPIFLGSKRAAPPKVGDSRFALVWRISSVENASSGSRRENYCILCKSTKLAIRLYATFICRICERFRRGRKGQVMNAGMPVLREPAPKRKGSRKLLFVVILLFFTLLSVLFFNSSISKISEIQVLGTMYADEDAVIREAAIEAGDPFFRSTSAAIAARVEKLTQVESATVEKKFPGVVIINVKEYPAVAFELTSQGEVVALLSNGTQAVARGDGMIIADKPVLTGWTDNDPVKIELTKRLGEIPSKQLADLSEIIPIPSKAYPDRIRIYTRTKFEVITAVSVLSDKIESLNAVIETQAPGKITMLLADTYVPFPSEESETINSE